MRGGHPIACGDLHGLAQRRVRERRRDEIVRRKPVQGAAPSIDTSKQPKREINCPGPGAAVGDSHDIECGPKACAGTTRRRRSLFLSLRRGRRGFFLVHFAVHNHGHLRPELSDQMDRNRMLAHGADRIGEDDLAAIDLLPDRG